MGGSIYDCGEERSFISDKGDIGFIDFDNDMSNCNYDVSTEGPVKISIPFPLVDNKPQSGYVGDSIVDKITVLNTTSNSVELYRAEIYDSKPEKSFTLSLMEPPSECSDVEYIQQYVETFSLEDRVLQPGKPLTIWLSCKPKELGLHTAAVHLTTEDDTIERLVFVLAVDKVAVSLAGNKTFKRERKKKQWSNLVTNEFVPGSRPPRASIQYFKNKLPVYPIPDEVRDILEQKQIPELIQEGLTKENYTSYFKHLVIMEEIKMEDDMRGYDMEHVSMKSKGPRFLTLEVPGLAEKRPSLVYGDSIFARLASVDEYDSSCTYQGFIHRVEAEVVFLNFEQGFHSRFRASNLYNVQFTYNRINMRRLYQAIEASQCLEAEFLFPVDSLRSRVIQTNPLVPISPVLNEEQEIAVQMILGCKGGAPYVIYGPPGTGKTMTVIEAILQLYRSQKSARILVCAPSNSAADHILEKIIGQKAVRIQNKDILRLNALTRPLEDIKPDYFKFSYYDEAERLFKCPPLMTLRRYKIVISTYASSSLLYAEGIKRDHFSHIFLDEAGQASEPETMVPLSNLCTRKTVVVLAGDPMQLGPVIYSKDAENYGLGKSYLKRLFEFKFYDQSDQNYVIKLVKNYRCHPAILHLPSTLFYQGELIACKDDETRFSAASEDLLPNKDFPVLFFGIQGFDEREGSNPSWFNRIEASKTVEIIRNLTETKGLSDEDIGVIAPYRQQVLKIKKALEDIDLSNIQVGSVEQFQGQERQVIIVSTVRSTIKHNDFDITHCLGFLSNPRRFNVAITRARSLLVVIGNPHIVCKDPYWNKLLWHCVDNGSYKGCFLPEREDLLDNLAAQDNLVNEPWQGECSELGKQEGFGELSQENEWEESSQVGGWNQVNCDPPWEGENCEARDETSQGGWNQVNCDPPWEGEYCETRDGTSQDREWGAPYEGEGWDQSTEVIRDTPWEGDGEPGGELSQEQGLGKPSQEECYMPSKDVEPGEAKFEPDEKSEWSDGWTMP